MSVCASHAVCDAGHKSHASIPACRRCRAPPLEYGNGGDEHGILRTTRPDVHLPAIGDVLWLIPGHCDPTSTCTTSWSACVAVWSAVWWNSSFRVDARGALT